MSRYYKIVVGPETEVPPGGAALTASQNAGATWTNLVNGKCDLGAQTMEIDAWVYSFDAPVSQAYVSIWGPSRAQISQASDFNGAHIDVYAGMQKGLPLATSQASQAGLILSGQIFQAFGNWQGINQTLNFVVTTDGGATQEKPANLQFSWAPGEQLAAVIDRTLAVAYPKYRRNINISPNLVLPGAEQGVYPTIQQFASYIKGVSLDILGGNYRGVSITLANGVFQVFDGTAPYGQATPITVQDLVGSPTWLNPFLISFSTVLRADLTVGSLVTFPPIAAAISVTTPQSQSNARTKNTFTGNWVISNMRHVGNSRAPEAQSWITIFQAYPENPQ